MIKSIPGFVRHAEFVEAIKPVLALAGLTPTELLVEGFEITGGSIRALTTTRPSWATDDDAISIGEDPAHAVQAWRIDVPVVMA